VSCVSKGSRKNLDGHWDFITIEAARSEALPWGQYPLKNRAFALDLQKSLT